MSEDTKYTFLFGAGAEESFGMPKGKEFAKEVLILDESIAEKVKEFYNNQLSKLKIDEDKYKNNKLIYASSRAIYYQTIKENEYSFENLYNNLCDREKIKKMLDNYDLYKSKDSVEKDKSELYTSYRADFETFCKNIWKKINNNSIENDNLNISEEDYEKVADFILENVKYYSQIDKQFNYLRSMNYDSSEFWTVLNTYAAAFFSIYNKAYDIADNNKLNDMENIIKKINETNVLNNQEINDSYYKILKDFIQGKEIDKVFNFMTTNYTSYLENIISNKVIYLNGKIGWFEDIKNLLVYDSKKDEHDILNNFVIPFIFVQSGIKPIVCTKQIEQYSNAILALNESKYLIVVGYNFNSDDNHINSIIAEWLRKNKERKLIYCWYKEKDDIKINNDEFILKSNGWLTNYKNQIEIEIINKKSYKNDFKSILKKYLQINDLKE